MRYNGIKNYLKTTSINFQFFNYKNINACFFYYKEITNKKYIYSILLHDKLKKIKMVARR